MWSSHSPKQLMVWVGHMTQFWLLGSEKLAGTDIWEKVFLLWKRNHESEMAHSPMASCPIYKRNLNYGRLLVTEMEAHWGQSKQARDGDQKKTGPQWSLRMNQPCSQAPLELVFCGIMEYSHFLNHLKLSFLLHAAPEWYKKVVGKNMKIPCRF